MKLNNCFLLLIISSIAVINARDVYVLKDEFYYRAKRLEDAQQQPLTTQPYKLRRTQLRTQSAKIGCQCYCSDLCGPRDAKSDDTPFIDPETGICFCKQRDKNNYIPNGCHLQPKPNFESCCDRRVNIKN